MEYNKFMSIYKLEHKFCPRCNSDKYITTLAGFIYDKNNPSEYKNLNRCTCLDCGDIHTTHERVNNSLIRDKKINKLTSE